jgi:hypothetical protein
MVGGSPPENTKITEPNSFDKDQTGQGSTLPYCIQGMEESMLDWISDRIVAIVTFVPALFVAEDSPNFMLIRAMFGLLLIVLVVYVVAMRPVRSAIARYMGKASGLIVRKPQK